MARPADLTKAGPWAALFVVDLAAPFFARHGDAFIAQLKADAGYIEEDFAQIRRIAYRRPFEECLTLAETVVDAAMGRS